MDNANIKNTDAGNSANNDDASLMSKIESIIDGILKSKGVATEKTKAAMDHAKTTVRERPLLSMIVMLFMGILVGRLYAMLRRA